MARKSFLSGLALFRIYRFQGLRALVLDVVVLCLIEGVELSRMQALEFETALEAYESGDLSRRCPGHDLSGSMSAL